MQGSGGVESSCRLIEEDDTRIGNELHSNRSSFALSTTNALDEGVSDFYVSATHQSQFADQILYDLMLFFLGLVDTQVTGKLETFTRCEGTQQCVFLHDVANLIGKWLH